MTTITMTPATAAKAFGRIAEFTGTVALRTVNFVRAYLNRRDVRTLAGFDDRMLADIGLTRGDVRDAVAEPLWRDPTTILVSRVQERRSARRPRASRASFRIDPAPSLVPELETGLRAGKLTRFPASYH
jgi:uncharacterized protein YjiS (DUF1127 family)